MLTTSLQLFAPASATRANPDPIGSPNENCGAPSAQSSAANKADSAHPALGKIAERAVPANQSKKAAPEHRRGPFSDLTALAADPPRQARLI